MPFGAIASVVGSAIGARNTKKTNETNLKINQMNNEFNERMLDKQNQFNLEQWNREVSYNDRVRDETNQYNSAREQVERYREAGLNPIMMMQGQGAGTSMGGTAPSTSSGSASAASPIPMQSYTPQFATNFGESLLGFLRFEQEKKLMDEQVEGLNIENQYKATQIMKSIANMEADTKSKEARSRLDNIISTFQGNLMQSQTQAAEAQAEQSRTAAALNLAKTAYTNKEVANFDAQFKVNTQEALARTMMYSANAGLSKQQTRTEIVKTMMSQFEAQGVKLDNKAKKQAIQLAERTADAIVEGMIQNTLPSIGKFGANTGDWFNSREYGKYPKK